MGIKRIGVLTGGGDCPGLNAVIRAVVKAAILQHGWEVIGIEDGFEGLIEPGRTRKLELADVRGLLPRGGTILGTTNRGNPFAFHTVIDGQEVVYDASHEVVEHIDQLGLDGLIVIGGDGSLSIGLDLARLGVPIIGVPKTIDNDLALTDVTFGFDTALDTATYAIDKLHTTAESHHRVMLVEVMGRNAGWIALTAGLAGGADVILIPEIPFSVEAICACVQERERDGAKFSIVVVAEGAAPVDGKQVFKHSGDGRALPRLGGIADRIGRQIVVCSGKETRVTVLGHLQRRGGPGAFDRILATRFGTAAVRLAAAGRFGQMVALQGTEIVSVPIEDAVRVPKRVDPEGEMVQTARELGISFGAPT